MTLKNFFKKSDWLVYFSEKNNFKRTLSVVKKLGSRNFSHPVGTLNWTGVYSDV